MKKFNLKFLSFLVVAIFSFAGCDKEVKPDEPDTTKPELTITKPQSSDVIIKSNEILLSGNFTDNVGLEKCTVSLSYNGQKNVSIVETAWEPADDVIALSGTEDALADKRIFGEPVPMDVLAGSYTIIVTVSDNSGNVAASSIDITIE